MNIEQEIQTLNESIDADVQLGLVDLGFDPGEAYAATHSGFNLIEDAAADPVTDVLA